MSKLNLAVIQPQKVKIRGEFDHLIVPGVDGDFGILPDHTPFITQIRPGILTLYDGSDVSRYAIHDGFVTVENNTVKIICDRIEAEKEIDAKRAENSRRRAEKRLSSGDKDVDFRRAETSLKRALARLNARVKSEL